MRLIRNIILGLGLLASTVLLCETAFSTEIASSDLSAQLAAVEGDGVDAGGGGAPDGAVLFGADGEYRIDLCPDFAGRDGVGRVEPGR